MKKQAEENGIEWLKVGGSEPARLAVTSRGEGTPFVWGHALLGSMAQDEEGGVLAWEKLTDIAQVIRYDARGHGRSDCNGEPEDFRWDKLATYMWKVADHFTSEPVVLGGASMGCGTSLHAACQRPDDVRGLVLVIPPTAWKWRTGHRGGYRITANFLKATYGLPLKMFGLARTQPSGDNFMRGMLALLSQHLPKVDYRGVVGAMRGAALSDFPPREELAKLQMPVLILAWPDDRTHPLEVAEELHRIIPNSTLRVDNSVDDPYQWPQTVRQFIQSLD